MSTAFLSIVPASLRRSGTYTELGRTGEGALGVGDLMQKSHIRRLDIEKGLMVEYVESFRERATDAIFGR